MWVGKRNQQEPPPTILRLVIDLGAKKFMKYTYRTCNGLFISSGTNDSPRSHDGSVKESALAGKNLGEVSEKLRVKKPLASARN